MEGRGPSYGKDALNGFYFLLCNNKPDSTIPFLISYAVDKDILVPAKSPNHFGS